MSLGLLKKTIIICIFSTSAFAEPLIGEFAHFKLLDKITNKVTEKAIAVNSSKNWDSLNIKVHACFFSKPEELPEDYVLLEVKDLLKHEKDNLYMGLAGEANENISGFTSKDNLITGKSKAKGGGAISVEGWKQN